MAVTLAALTNYLQRTQRLLSDATFQRFNPYDLVEYINEGRAQVAGEALCIRARGTISTAANTNTYAHSAITLPTGLGYSSTIVLERILYLPAGLNPVLLEGRPLAWFNLYFQALGKAPSGPPAAWTQYQQGPNGSFLIGPVADDVYSLSMDVFALPSSLTMAGVGSEVDALPYPWSDAAPFYAASLALAGAGQLDAADKMFAQYEGFMRRGTINVTPYTQPMNFPGRPSQALQSSTRYPAAVQGRPGADEQA